MKIEEKLESLRRCVERVDSRRPADAKALAADVDAQDILTVNLTRAIQLCVDISAQLLTHSGETAPGTMAECFTRLAEAGVIDEDLATRLRAAVGFRNVAIHQYQALDWEIVYAIAGERLDDFRAFAAAVVGSLERGN